MSSEAYKMSVRGSKNKVIIYVVGACCIAFAILLYHNASQRLEAMEVSYERCHLNEESLSAQLQVNLEYKIRLEKSLQQEKSDHAQTKEELQKKLEDERQTRERENLDAINKFSNLKEHFNSMQHKLDVVQDKYEKSKQLHLSEVNDKRYLNELVEKLRQEVSLLKENNEKESNNKVKLAAVESEKSILEEQNRKLREKIDIYEKMRTSPSDEKLPNNFLLGPLKKNDGNENQFRLPGLAKDGGFPSSTTPSKMERELLPSANSILAKVSTPMINPMAVQNEDKIIFAPPPQPRAESSSTKDPNIYDAKENVAPKPEEVPKDGSNNILPVQDVLGAPDLLHNFFHIPAVREYKKQMKESEKNNHAGEVGDEDEGMGKNVAPNPIRGWQEGELRDQLLPRNHMANEIPRNAAYQYVGEDEGRKEEGEDDDDLDPIDGYQNDKDKNIDLKENVVKPVIQMPFGGKHDSVMLQPK